MKVGILTTFYNLDSSYSLASIVYDQMIMLTKYGYETVLLVHDNFEDESKVPQGVEIRKVVPRFNLVDYAAEDKLRDDFEEQVEKIISALEPALSDLDVVLTHDIVFQGWFLPYNAAIRKIDNPGLRWLHWIHSAPSIRQDGLPYPFSCRFCIPENAKIVYLNSTDSIKAAEMFGTYLDNVRVVHNPKDPRTFWDCDPFTFNLINKYNLLDADIIDIYPLSMPRAISGKQLDKVIWTMSKLKLHGKKIRLIACNAHANSDKEKDDIERIYGYAEKCGLTREELIFTSLEEGCKYEQTGVTKKIISELFQLSNIFIFPTRSENCPLILLEAALAKTLLVINASFKPLSEFFGGNAIYFQFGSLTETVNYMDEEKYYDDVAKIIISELRNNKPLNAFNVLKQEYNLDYIFKNQLEPLLWEGRDAQV